MLQYLKNKATGIKNAAGLEIILLDENKYIINCVVLGLQKGKISIIRSHYNIKDIKDLAGKISREIPVALIINGKGIIQKKLDPQSEISLATLYPGINPKDFLIREYSNNHLRDISLLRKESATLILEQLEISGITVTSVSLSFHELHNILSLINHEGEISATSYNITVAANSIIDYQPTTIEEKEIAVRPDINIASDYIKTNFILAYSAAIGIFVNGLTVSDNDGFPGVINNRNEIIQNKTLKFYLQATLISTFIILLINYVVYDHYFRQTNTLKDAYNFAISRGARSDSVRIKLQKQKAYLAEMGWLDDKKMISFSADRIARTVPEQIKLTGMSLYPAISRSSSFAEKQWHFQRDTIIITGQCSNPDLLTAWTGEIEKIKNVHQARISNFLFKKQNEPGTFVVEIFTR